MEIKEYVKNRKSYLTETINNLEEKPHLLIIQVNNDEASNAYVKGKKKDLDFNLLDEYIKNNTTERGILLKRKYYGIIAKK